MLFSTISLTLLLTLTTALPSSPLLPRQITYSDSGVISYNDYNSLPKTGGDPACGTPYGSVNIDHIVSLHGNNWPGPYCGLCFKVCAATCDYFLVADSKGDPGIEVNNSTVSGAVLGIPSELGAGHVTGTWEAVDQKLCTKFWNGVQDNTPALGYLQSLADLIAAGY